MEWRDLKGATEQMKADIMGKTIQPEEISNAILFLISNEAALTTGSILAMDNGSTAGESNRLLVRK
jgi:enoyl-[acyl-carrier-protein] reductase (NADH)